MTTTKNYRIEPKLFILYIAMGSMIMFFTSQFSALIVKKGDIKHWVAVELPITFLYSTLVIVLSSFTIHIAKSNLQKLTQFKLYWVLSILLSIIFIVLQYKGWLDLKAQGVFLTGNPSGSFIYFISLMHALHFIGGIIALVWIGYRQNKNTKIESLKLTILTQYWHFIGITWVFIYIFFKFIIYQ